MAEKIFYSLLPFSLMAGFWFIDGYRCNELRFQ